MGVYKRNGCWWIDYNLEGQRVRKKIGKDKRQAQRVLDKIRYDTTENKFQTITQVTAPKIVHIKFEDFADEYLELHSKVNNRSWKSSDLRNITVLKQHFSGKYLNEITPRIVEEFKAKRIKEVAPATVNKNLATLKSIFNKAIYWDRFIGKNPVGRVKLFHLNNKIVRFLEKDEIITLLGNSCDYLRPIVMLALNTGMRKREMLDLKWENVDFQRRVIYLLNTKNGEKREVPMNQNVVDAFSSVRRCGDTYIFINEKYDKPYYGVRKCFDLALKKSGIKCFRFHDLRHTFASHLVMNGIDLNTVRELLGHKSLEMTLRYAHLSHSHKRDAVEVLARNVTLATP